MRIEVFCQTTGVNINVNKIDIKSNKISILACRITIAWSHIALQPLKTWLRNANSAPESRYRDINIVLFIASKGVWCLANKIITMAPWNGNISHITGRLGQKSFGHQWTRPPPPTPTPSKCGAMMFPLKKQSICRWFYTSCHPCHFNDMSCRDGLIIYAHSSFIFCVYLMNGTWMNINNNTLLGAFKVHHSTQYISTSANGVYPW